MSLVAAKPWDLRVGRWQDALADVAMVDAVIVDAPYSERVHAGHNSAAAIATAAAREADYRRRTGKGVGAASMKRNPINYEHWSADDVRDFVQAWSSRCLGWFVSMTDDVLADAWKRELANAGRYVFAPIPFINPGSGCRYLGDGPSNWTVWIIVARPRTRAAQAWGTLPGAYTIPRGENDRAGGAAHGGSAIVGGKPLSVMRAIIRDYTRPGDLVCDPCAGAGTTLLAACKEGRRAIGAEMDPTTALRAVKRLLHADLSPPLFADIPRERPAQLSLDATQPPLDKLQAPV